MRRAFQIALLLVAFIPFALGALTLVMGAARFVPETAVTAQLDSQMRFSAIWSMTPFFLAIWIVRNLEASRTVLIIVLSATAAAGFARVLSATQFGAPPPPMIGAIIFEIAVLLFIPWHRAVVGRGISQARA